MVQLLCAGNGLINCFRNEEINLEWKNIESREIRLVFQLGQSSVDSLVSNWEKKLKCKRTT